MVDKVAKLAPFARRDEEPPTPQELEEAECEAEKLLAERRRRRGAWEGPAAPSSLPASVG